VLIKFNLLERQTQRDIQKKDGACGCYRLNDKRWFICSFHEGFDAAMELTNDLTDVATRNTEEYYGFQPGQKVGDASVTEET